LRRLPRPPRPRSKEQRSFLYVPRPPWYVPGASPAKGRPRPVARRAGVSEPERGLLACDSYASCWRPACRRNPSRRSWRDAS
jgi:hypothetical protein